MAWDNLLSGLLGAVIGGVIGAALGFLGALCIYRRTAKDVQRAAGRALLAEMSTNAERALSAESTRVLHEFWDVAWRSQLPLVSQLLHWPDLKKLVSAYDSGARGYENARDALALLAAEERRLDESSPEIGKELERDRKRNRIEENRRRIDQWFREVAGEWIEAMRVLRGAAIDCGERKIFDQDLTKLEERLKTAP
jgi:hypothetical protein